MGAHASSVTYFLVTFAPDADDLSQFWLNIGEMHTFFTLEQENQLV